jgi:hypothetical protein
MPLLALMLFRVVGLILKVISQSVLRLMIKQATLLLIVSGLTNAYVKCHRNIIPGKIHVD